MFFAGEMYPECVTKLSCEDEYSGVKPRIYLSDLAMDFSGIFKRVAKCNEMIKQCGCGNYVASRDGDVCVDKEKGCTAPCTCEKNGIMTQLQVCYVKYIYTYT